MSDHRAEQRRELRQVLAGSRSRFRMALAAMLALPSCGLLPSSHYEMTTLPLSPERGWVQLPTRRWLVNPGIEPDALMFCPSENCGQQAFFARMELTGREVGFADLLIADPARALSAARSTQKSRHNHAVRRADITPISVAGWTGGNVRLESARNSGKEAHAAVLAQKKGVRAFLILVVAPSTEETLQRLRLALE